MEQQTSLMWDKCLSIIRDNITPEQYSASFAFVKLHSFVDGKMVLDVPSEFVKKYIEVIGYFKVLYSTMSIRPDETEDVEDVES